ncbi:MAG: DNA repair protein RecN [Verrucomicrobia bacterium ADurb.Bin345]|nr:MAG: DNA repair protein RecN [Verrucomicrobia bacterium ADurb.Bin345]
MLSTLRVKNLALVEQARVEFAPGLNVITGETGAGKSVLIGALNMLLGARADKSLIRAGEDACGAEAAFRLADSSAVDEILERYGLEACTDGQLIIRRIIRASGSSQNLVNDQAVTLQVLEELGELLVDMHGPHDHQSLLNPQFQLDLLDAFGHLWTARSACEKIFSEWKALEARKAELEGGGGDVAGQIDLLSWRVREIEQAAPEEGEEERITEEHRLAGNAQHILELAGRVLGGLTEGEGSAFDGMVAAQKGLEELARLVPEAETWRGEVRETAVRIQEVSAQIHELADRVEADPARLEWLDNRLAEYQKLKRKYGGSVAEVLKVLEESRARLRDLETRGGRLKEIEAAIRDVERRFRDQALRLREGRAKAAGGLASAITDEIQALGFAHGSFSVGLNESEPCASGMDAVEFGFAPNVGEPSRPLRAIASSGEISRVMLATKAVLAGHDRIPVMIFDEIDANVGGEMGTAVGRKLAEVAENHQVICITHLPQVAVFGRHHLAVRKSVRGERTVTEVEPLAEPARVEEVARMLGGRDLTSVALKHAREMLAGVPRA